MKKSSLILLPLLNKFFKFSNALDDWSYKSNGADWPQLYSNCAGPTQSPIDLPKLGGNSNITIISYSEENFFKQYQNP